MKAKIVSVKSTTTSTMTLPKEFNSEVNLPLLAQAVRVYEWQSHPATSKVQTRATVSFTKKKMYRQKGTGRARHGAKSAPIFVGGGVAHGPKGVRRELSLPKKMSKKAYSSALSFKAKENLVVVVGGLEKITKTAEAQKFLDKAAKGYRTLALSSGNYQAARYFRNIKNLSVIGYNKLNAYNVYFGGTLLIDKDVFAKPKAAVKKTIKKTNKK